MRSGNAHASFYADLAEELSSRLEGPNALAARDRIEAELENIRVALGWCLDPPADGKPPPPERLTIGLRLCQAMSWFWYAFGYTAEGHRWQRRAVAVASAAGGPELATALHGLAVLLLQQGETAEAKDALTTCLQIRRETATAARRRWSSTASASPTGRLAMPTPAGPCCGRASTSRGRSATRAGSRPRCPTWRLRDRGQQLRPRHRPARAGAGDRRETRERLGLRSDPVQPDRRDAADRPGRRGLRVAAQPGG